MAKGNVVPTLVAAEHIGPSDTGDNIEAKRVANYIWNGSSWERDTGGGSSSGGSTEAAQDEQTYILNLISSAVQAIASAKGIAADLRVTVLGGAITISSGTITTVTTVTTVASVTNMVSIGSQPAAQLIPSNQNQVAIMSNINNVV